PLVTGAIDLLLGGETGNSCFAEWPGNMHGAGTCLEAIYVLECIAPPRLHADRFLPPMPVRVLVDEHGNDVGNNVTNELLRTNLVVADAHELLDVPEFREHLLPTMVHSAERIANNSVPATIDRARKQMASQLQHEITRLRELQKVNRSVRGEEIEMLIEQQRALDEHLSASRLRLDALRVILARGAA